MRLPSLQSARYALVLFALVCACRRPALAQAIAAPPVDCPTSQDSNTAMPLAQSLVKAEQFGAAECIARRLVKTEPSSADAHYLLGYILSRRGKANESLAEYTSGARFRRPGSSELAVVALDYVLLKDYPDARKWMTQAIAGDQSNPLYWYYLGRIDYNLNTFDEARAAFEKALVLEPGNTRDLYNLGLTLEGLGQPERAISIYQQAIRGEENMLIRDAQPYFDMGSLLLRKNRTSEALQYLQQAAVIDPSNAAIYEELGSTEEQLNQLAAAQKDMERAVELVPDVSSLHFQLGRIYQKEHMTAEAKAQFAMCAKEAGAHSSRGDDTLNSLRPR